MASSPPAIRPLLTVQLRIFLCRFTLNAERNETVQSSDPAELAKTDFDFDASLNADLPADVTDGMERMQLDQ